MTVYRAENIETGEVIEGGARYLAISLGVTIKDIYRASSMKYKVRCVWFISSNQQTKTGSKSEITPQLLAEWDRVTAPFKKASAKALNQMGNQNLTQQLK